MYILRKPACLSSVVCCLLDFGCWSLVVGRWLLFVVCCWLGRRDGRLGRARNLQVIWFPQSFFAGGCRNS